MHRRHVRARRTGTVCTAWYQPSEGRVTYCWPGASWAQSFDDFATGSRTVTIGRAD